MHRITELLDTDAGAALMAAGAVILTGVGAICAMWPDAVVFLVFG